MLAHTNPATRPVSISSAMHCCDVNVGTNTSRHAVAYFKMYFVFLSIGQFDESSSFGCVVCKQIFQATLGPIPHTTPK